MRTMKRLGHAAVMIAITINEAHAGASGLPWEAPLQQLTDSLTGPVLQTFLILSAVVAGLMMAKKTPISGFRAWCRMDGPSDAR